MSDSRWIYVTFDREVWRFPADLVAESRAYYYACVVDGHEKNSKEYLEELKNSYEPDILIEWAKINMDWADVESKAEFVQRREHYLDYQGLWANSEMEVIYE